MDKYAHEQFVNLILDRDSFTNHHTKNTHKK